MNTVDNILSALNNNCRGLISPDVIEVYKWEKHHIVPKPRQYCCKVTREDEEHFVICSNCSDNLAMIHKK